VCLAAARSVHRPARGGLLQARVLPCTLGVAHHMRPCLTAGTALPCRLTDLPDVGRRAELPAITITSYEMMKRLTCTACQKLQGVASKHMKQPGAPPPAPQAAAAAAPQPAGAADDAGRAPPVAAGSSQGGRGRGQGRGKSPGKGRGRGRGRGSSQHPPQAPGAAPEAPHAPGATAAAAAAPPPVAAAAAPVAGGGSGARPAPGGVAGMRCRGCTGPGEGARWS
jgi:hypothetical protein